MSEKKVIVCVKHRISAHQPSCATKGSEALAKEIEAFIASKRLMLTVERFKCLGACDHGINIKLVPEGPFLRSLSLDHLEQIECALEQFASPTNG